MKQLEPLNKEFQKDFKIGEFSDLSIVEIIILQILLRYPEPFIRHSLYIEVKDFLKTRKLNSNLGKYKKLSTFEKKFYKFLEDKKELSTSSFYNSLENLEKKGLILFNLNKSGKVLTVEATPLTKVVIKVISEFIVFNNLIFKLDFQEEVIQYFLKLVNQEYFENSLYVMFSKSLDIKLAQSIQKFSGNFFVLSKIKSQEDLIKQGIEKATLSEVFNGQLREPNDCFDLCVVPSYQKNLNFYGLTRNDLLKELIRVTKKKGNIILVGRSQLPRTENYYADELISMYQPSVENRIFSKEQLEQDFNNAGISKVEIIDYNGMLVGVGWV